MSANRYVIVDFWVDNGDAVFSHVEGPFEGDADDAQQRCDAMQEELDQCHMCFPILEGDAQQIEAAFHGEPKT